MRSRWGTSASMAGRQRQQQHLERVRRIEHRLFVLLKVLLVRARQALQQDRQPLRVGEQPRALSRGQLEQVGIALLRQQARAGREPVGGVNQPKPGEQ
jgi:hypothetical protein